MDDNHTLYAPDTTDHLVALLKPAFPDFTFYDAWPNVIPPGSAWPLMIVQLLNTKPVLGPTETDEVPETVEITVMLNQADAAGSGNVRTTTRRRLQHLIQGQDPTVTNTYKADSLLGVLRKYLSMDGWLINTDIAVQYDTTPPPKDLSSMVGATITLTTWRRTIVQNRT